MNRSAIGLILLITVFCQVTAQDLRFNRLTTDDGLSQSWVRSAYQDRSGFLWFATADGLDRFDGYEFARYIPVPGDSTSIGNGSVRFMAEKSATEMWVCTDGGVFIYNVLTDDFRPLRPMLGYTTRRVLVEDSVIWFGTDSGLMKYAVGNSQITKFSFKAADPTSLSHNAVYEIFRDTKGRLWIGTYAGLNLLRDDGVSFRRFLENKSGSRNYGWVSGIAEDSRGRIWLASNGGLDVLYDSDSPSGFSITRVSSVYTLGVGISNQNELWVGRGVGNGLDIMDLAQFEIGQNARFRHYEQIAFNDESLSDNTIIYLYKDQLGDLWLCTYGGGVNYYSPRMKQFDIERQGMDPDRSISNNLVNAIYENDQHLWIGTENGLNRIDKQTKEVKPFHHISGNGRSLGANAVYRIYEDSKKTLWIGCWNGGLNQYNPETEDFSRYMPNGVGSISWEHVFGIDEYEKQLWVATVGGGANVFDFQQRKFSYFQHDPDDSLSIGGNAVNDLLATSDNRLFVSSGVVLNEYLGDVVFKKYPITIQENPAEMIFCLFESRDGTVWVGTNDGLMALEQPNPRSFTTREGLPNNTIQAIEEDGSGNLWVSTNRGISRITLNTDGTAGFRNFSMADGLPANEFIKRSSFKNKNGFLYFGSSNGYVRFHPDSIKENIEIPPVIITGFEVENGSKPLSKQELGALKHRPGYLLELDHTQSDFTIRYAGLNYLSPSQNQYKYKLEGYDDNWREVGSRREASYTSLDAGSYVFLVLGSNNDGLWSTVPTTLKIEIMPAWYDLFWVRAFGVVLLAMVFVFIARWRINFYRQNSVLLEKMVEERTTEIKILNEQLQDSNEELTISNDALVEQRNKLEQALHDLNVAKDKLVESEKLASLGVFTAGIGHELNNPINYIAGSTMALFELLNEKIESGKPMDDDDLEQVRLLEESLKEGVKKTTTIVNSLRNYARQDDDRFVEYNLIECIEDAIILLNNRHSLNIEIVRKYPDNVIIECLPGRLNQIFINLLDNAIDAIGSAGKITIEVEEFRASVIIRITDSGRGINQRHQKQLFDPFFTTKEVGEGTGLGLYLVYGFVSKHGGTILVDSEEGKGATFTIELPVRQIHN